MFVCKYYIIKWGSFVALFYSQVPGIVYKFLFVFPVPLLLTQKHEHDAYNSKLVLTYTALHLFVNQIDTVQQLANSH